MILLALPRECFSCICTQGIKDSQVEVIEIVKTSAVTFRLYLQALHGIVTFSQ